MASSQIQIPSHVLRDHNQGMIRRDGERECGSTTRFVFQKNIDELVRDHLTNYDDPRRQQKTRILDRWAANQAKDTMKERHKPPELLGLCNSQSVSERASTFLRETSPTLSSSPGSPSSVGVPNLHASSLVQRWKEFEAEAISPRANQSGGLNSNSNARLKRMNSTKSNTGSSPVGSEADYRYDAVDSPQDPMLETEQVAPSDQCKCQPSLQRQSSDVNEGSRVQDIVKKLTSGSHTSQSASSPLSSCNQSDHIVSEPAVPSVEHSAQHQGGQKDLKKRFRVRGRQATKDLLTQMVQERKMEVSQLSEIRAVSQFSQRGRIQSLLRLKLLQRGGVLVHEQQRPALTSSELGQLQGRSTFVLLKEKFSMRSQQGVDVPAMKTDNLKNLKQSLNMKQNSGNDHSRVEDNLETRTQLPKSFHVSQKEDNRKNPTPGQMGIFDRLTDQNVHHGDIITSEDNAQVLELDYSMPSSMDSKWQPEHHSLPSMSEHINDSNCCTSDMTETVFCYDSHDSGSPIDDERAMDDWSPDVTKVESDVCNTQQAESVDSWEMLTVQEDLNTNHSVESPNASWLNDVSYSPRDWECQKETWYDENDSDNEDIHALLERRTVSRLLASGFRERMERVLALHLKRHPEILGGVELEEEIIDHHYPDVTDTSDPGASPSFQLPSPSSSGPWSRDQESSNNSDQVAYTTSPSSLGTWSRDQESSNNSDQVAYTQLQPNKTLSSDYQGTQQCSPITSRSSLEMEFIYNLKGNIEKLQFEMSEIRESIKSCIGMQVQLQNVIKQEVEAAVYRTMSAVRKGEVMELPMPTNTPKMKGNCCVCCSTQVDSLLYRCGHMCTCFKCAQELQYSSSRCPICRAPILDVVKTYSDI